ncbi:efflux RND transporter periplasmic adaptor subunit [Granulicella cerasi]|uniref:Efflux RND transporter periplasmic adaptor subunit n=1 Tax=Granulicella cerasi TaxID=741063 RepID=A0ABW1ZAA9_9BACT|nr:efflux RND transporter periplasmic adaptor subunit [Granulicella cerasi]
MTARRFYFTPLAASVAALVFVGGCKKHTTETAAPTQPTANIQVGTVHSETIDATLRLPGRVEADPDKLVHIYAPLSGRLLNMTLVPGQEVRKGQAVATLQSSDVAQARADFEKAKIETIRADHALDRGKLLASHEVMSQADLQELQATDSAAHSELERTRQHVHELGFSENSTSDITTVTAPITGTVLDIGTATGEMQRSLETTTGIATVANLDTVWVTGDVYEQDLHAVHPHAQVTVSFTAYPGEKFSGTVANIGDSFDPSTHAVKVRVVMPNPGHRLKPQMFATLLLSQPAQPRILLPAGAVLHDGESTIVYVPAGDGKYTTKKVTTGAQAGDRIEITSGLNDGDRVVMQGAAFLRQPVGD